MKLSNFKNRIYNWFKIEPNTTEIDSQASVEWHNHTKSTHPYVYWFNEVALTTTVKATMSLLSGIFSVWKHGRDYLIVQPHKIVIASPNEVFSWENAHVTANFQLLVDFVETRCALLELQDATNEHIKSFNISPWQVKFSHVLPWKFRSQLAGLHYLENHNYTVCTAIAVRLYLWWKQESHKATREELLKKLDELYDIRNIFYGEFGNND